MREVADFMRQSDRVTRVVSALSLAFLVLAARVGGASFFPVRGGEGSAWRWVCSIVRVAAAEVIESVWFCACGCALAAAVVAILVFGTSSARRVGTMRSAKEPMEAVFRVVGFQDILPPQCVGWMTMHVADALYRVGRRPFYVELRHSDDAALGGPVVGEVAADSAVRTRPALPR